jgi:periplasmic protein TonB
MFDRFVLGSRPSWKRRAVLIASLSLHGAALVALVVASYFQVAEIAPPPLAIVFLSAPEPPPPPSPPAHKKAPEPRRVTTPSPHPQPTLTPPSEPQPTTTSDNATPDGKGPPDGIPGGDPNSPPGTNGPPGPSAPAPRPRNVAPHALDAQKIAGALPHLPSSVRSARRGLGDTNFTARICVDQSGRVSSVSVLQNIPGADDSILATLREWRYKPQPIPVCFITQLVFDVE